MKYSSPTNEMQFTDRQLFYTERTNCTDRNHSLTDRYGAGVLDNPRIPCFAAVEECAEHAGLVDMQFCLHSEAGVVPDPMASLAITADCFCNPAVRLCILSIS